MCQFGLSTTFLRELTGQNGKNERQKRRTVVRMTHTATKLESRRCQCEERETLVCSVLLVIVECDADHIQCDGRCVSSHEICDAVTNCLNAEDERNCCMY